MYVSLEAIEGTLLMRNSDKVSGSLVLVRFMVNVLSIGMAIGSLGVGIVSLTGV